MPFSYFTTLVFSREKIKSILHVIAWFVISNLFPYIGRIAKIHLKIVRQIMGLIYSVIELLQL